MESPTVPIIGIYSDIGHEADDIYALMVAFKDHLLGKVKIAFVCTVSCNNHERV